MFHTVWEFHARPERLEEFERHYGAEGSWAQLFRRAPGYRHTLCLRSADDATRFLVLDVWTSAADFASFKQQHGRDYEELDRACEALTLVEKHVGTYDEAV